MYENKFNFDNIANVLLQGFSTSDLMHLSYHSDFRELKSSISLNNSLSINVALIITFSIQKLLVEKLLLWIQSKNPERFALHQPYIEGDFFNFQCMSLQRVDFSYSNMSAGKFRFVNFQGADFSYSKFKDAILLGVDLRHIRNTN